MKYKYVGTGAGVPGLPHEITDEEALELGVVQLLQEALKNGDYVFEVVEKQLVETTVKTKKKE